MKCPNCGYEHGWSGEILDQVEGDHGDFYTLPVKMEKNEDWQSFYAQLYACPACKVAFIED